MFQIMLLCALLLMLSQSTPMSTAIIYGIGTFVIHAFGGTHVFSVKIWPMILLKTLFAYLFFRLLEWMDGKTFWWWLFFFIGVPLLFLCDRWLGIPLLPGFSGIPFVDTPF